jgi:hypothetical protein
MEWDGYERKPLGQVEKYLYHKRPPRKKAAPGQRLDVLTRTWSRQFQAAAIAD